MPLAPAGHFLETLDLAETLYGRLRQPTIFRLSPLAGDEPDGSLHRAGYRHLDETLVLTTDLKGDLRIDPDVMIGTEPTPSWSEGFATANGISPEMRGVHDRMLASILMPAGYATVVEDGKPVAYGLAVVERGMVGLFDIVTVSEARRRGAGRLLVKSLLAWGRSQGATASLSPSTWNQRGGAKPVRQLRLSGGISLSLPDQGLINWIQSRI